MAVLLAAAWTLAWQGGSIAAADWLPWAALGALVLAAVLFSGNALRPSGLALGGVAALLAYAVWIAISLTWSPLPSLARDEALLTGFYAAALAVPLLTMRDDAGRLAALAGVTGALVVLAVATGVRLVVTGEPSNLYNSGRLFAPIGYWNAQAAMFLVGFWPAVVLAAKRSFPLLGRAIALGGAVALLAGWLMTQSKGGAIALAASAVVFFAVGPARLRCLLPALVAAAAVGAAYEPLTEPFRAGDEALEDAIRTAGLVLVLLAAGGAVVGLVYAAADRRLDLPARTRHVLATTTLLGVVAAASVGVFAYFRSVDEPTTFLQDQWEAFKQPTRVEEGSSHLLSLGSNRWDFWGRAVDQFEEHPVAGIGSRGFAVAYLAEKRSNETPQRAHSLELDALAETGVVGFALLAAALALPLAAMFRSSGRGLVTAGVFGAAVYWLVHASGDWNWTLPAAGLPFFLLLGIGASAGARRRLRARVTVPLGAAVVVAALVAFAPPWLSARFTERVGSGSSTAERDLDLARRLDPLSVDPYLTEAALAASPEEAIPPLEQAVEKEPRSSGLHYLLGLRYLEAGRREDARETLRVARRLDPTDAFIQDALRRARRR